MVEIRYDNKNSRVFELLFPLHEYVPQRFFEMAKENVGAELYFYLDLLVKNATMPSDKSSTHVLIWSIHYECLYEGIPFTMIYDEDYDIIHFATEPENRVLIAQVIQTLVEEQKLS